MLMYRFSMEVEKARLSLDLNVDVVPRMGDHIVPTAANHPVVNQSISDTNQFNLNGGFSMEIPQYQLPIDVSSTASSTELNTRANVRAHINNSTLGTGYVHGHVISEIGESSTRVKGEHDIDG
ncbi:unnamed protein product [Brassica rapa subsp. trilocularis]